MFRITIALGALLLMTPPVHAQAADFVAVREADAFLAMVEGRTLRIPLYGLTISLAPDGSITGNALGWDLTGRWSWQDGYFCREIDWSGTEVPFNCQLVEARDDRLRFTVDRGAGDSAVFRLR